MSDQADLIDEIILVMKRCWDLPADCNEGELYAYAEIVADKLRAGASRGELEDYLRNVQVEKMEMPDSRAPGEIVERATGLFNPSR